jgi:hypothetical protein
MKVWVVALRAPCLFVAYVRKREKHCARTRTALSGGIITYADRRSRRLLSKSAARRSLRSATRKFSRSGTSISRHPTSSCANTTMWPSRSLSVDRRSGYFEPHDRWCREGTGSGAWPWGRWAIRTSPFSRSTTETSRRWSSPKMVSTFGGWGTRVVFVPDDELHEPPEIEVREPDPDP